jgi:hypothetical protein
MALSPFEYISALYCPHRQTFNLFLCNLEWPWLLHGQIELVQILLQVHLRVLVSQLLFFCGIVLLLGCVEMLIQITQYFNAYYLVMSESI